MVFSPEHLAREVRRQLIETGALRKKLTADPVVRASLERLEASQLFILRKLEEHTRESGGDKGDNESEVAPESETEEQASPEAPHELEPFAALSGCEAPHASEGPRAGRDPGGASPDGQPPPSPYSLN